MMQEEWIESALRQYRHTPALLRGEYDGDTALGVLNHLVDRDEMECRSDLRSELQAADEALADALADSGAVWRERLQSGAALAGFSGSLWWIAVSYHAQRRLGCSVKLSDVLGGHADSWFRISGSTGATVSVPGAAIRVLRSLNEAMKAVMPPAQALDRPVADLSRLTELSLSIAVPGSLTLGLQLPRQVAGEAASGPHEMSIEALDRLVEAGMRFDPRGTPDAIGDIVPDVERGRAIWKAFRRIYSVGRRAGGTIALESTVPHHAGRFAWDVSERPTRRRSAPPPQRPVRVTGNVRVVDLDRCLARIRVPGSDWLTEVVAEPSLFVEPAVLASRLGNDVTAIGYTEDTSDPPRKITAHEFGC